MKWNIQEERKLKKLYSQTNFPLEKIAKIISRSVPAISNRLTKLKVKRWYSLKCKIPSKITPALARIHAHICGDGYVYSYKTKDIYGPWAKYRKNPIRTKYFIGYSNNNIDLLKEFQKDIYKVFKIKGKKIYKNDDDYGRIRVKCVNKKGLTQLIKMLKEFVPCHLMPKKGFYWGHTVCINTNKKDAPRFFSRIGSIRYHAEE